MFVHLNSVAAFALVIAWNSAYALDKLIDDCVLQLMFMTTTPHVTLFPPPVRITVVSASLSRCRLFSFIWTRK